jgi:hypothetical protein
MTQDPFTHAFVIAAQYDLTRALYDYVKLNFNTIVIRRLYTHFRETKTVNKHAIIPHYGITVGDFMFYALMEKIHDARDEESLDVSHPQAQTHSQSQPTHNVLLATPAPAKDSVSIDNILIDTALKTSTSKSTNAKKTEDSEAQVKAKPKRKYTKRPKTNMKT